MPAYPDTKNAVNTLHMVFLTTGLVAVQFALWGYSLAFGPDAGGYGFIGTLDWAGLADVVHDAPSLVYATTIPHGTFMVFQMMFAIITPALIVASVAERMKFSAFKYSYYCGRHLFMTCCTLGMVTLSNRQLGMNSGYSGLDWRCRCGLLFAGGTVSP